MEREKLDTEPADSRQPSVTNRHVGLYWVTSKTYSRKRCLATMVAMDPNVRIIYVKFNNLNFEVAKRSGRHLAKGRLIFHFNAHWKIESVEAKMPSPPPNPFCPRPRPSPSP
jgi:hypothetical protein